MITYRLLSLLFTSSLALSACRPSFMAEQRPPGPKERAPAQRLDPTERSCSVTAQQSGNSTFMLLSNPFSRGGNTVGEVLPSVPVGSRVYKYVNGNYEISTLDEFSDPPTWTTAMVINPGEGFWLEAPPTAGGSITVEFRGLAPDSSTEVSRELPAGQMFVLVGSKLGRTEPQLLTHDLHFPIQPGDQVFQYSSAARSWRTQTFDEFDLNWTDSEPSLFCGEAVFVSRANLVAATWIEQVRRNLPPIADAGMDRSVGVGAPLSFSALLSSDPDGQIVSAVWDFGDGWNSTEFSPSHSYAALGTYHLTLTVTDNDGAMSTDTAIITVTSNNQPPVANAGPDQRVEAGAAVRLSAFGSWDPEGSSLTYHWDFGDGQSSTEFYPWHVYNTVGVYTARLTVTDNRGATGTDTAIITVTSNNQPPVANAGPDQTVYVGTSFSLDGSQSYDPDGGIVSYRWDFGNGTSTTGARPSWWYSTPGTYVVTLTVTDNQGATGTDTLILTASDANRPPVAQAGPDLTIPARENFIFRSDGSFDPDGLVVSYLWDFGDGQTGSGWMTQHSFFNAGVYTVRLTVTDDDGDTATDTAIITVTPNNHLPVANAGADQVIPETDLALLDARLSSDSDGRIASYHWNFGDGSSALGSGYDLHRFPGPGTYEVTLTVTDNEGAVSRDTLSVRVVAAAVPAAPSNLIATAVTAQQIDISWRDNSSDEQAFLIERKGPGEADFAFLWKKSAGAVSFYEKSLTPASDYSYRVRAISAAGYSAYSNVLTVRTPGDSSCLPMLEDESYQYQFSPPPPPVVQVGASGGTASFTVSVGSNCLFSMGSNNAFVTIVGSSSRLGAQTIQLNVAQNTSPLSRTATITVGSKSVTIEQAGAGVNLPPLARFSPPETTSVGSVLSLSAEKSRDPDGTITSYLWDFGDGTSAQGVRVTHVYSLAREYPIRLTVIDNRGASTTRSSVILATTNPTHRLKIRGARSLVARSNDQIAAQTLDSQGNLHLAGSLGGSPYVEKLSPTGAVLWTYSAAQGSGNFGAIQAVAVDRHGNVIIGGWFSGAIDFGGGVLEATGGGYDAFLAKISPSGAHLWSKRFGGLDRGVGLVDPRYALSGVDNVLGVGVHPTNDSIAFVGRFDESIDFGEGSFSGSFGNLYIAVVSASGEYIASRSVKSDSAFMAATGVAINAEGAILVTGVFTAIPATIDFGLGAMPAPGDGRQFDGDSFLAKFTLLESGPKDQRLQALWQRHFKNISIYRMAMDGNGDLILRGMGGSGNTLYGLGTVTRGRSYVEQLYTGPGGRFETLVPVYSTVPGEQPGVLGKFSSRTGETLWAMNFPNSLDAWAGIDDPISIDRENRITTSTWVIQRDNKLADQIIYKFLNAGMGLLDFFDPDIGAPPYRNHGGAVLQLEPNGTPRFYRAMPMVGLIPAIRGDGRLLTIFNSSYGLPLVNGVTELKVDRATLRQSTPGSGYKAIFITEHEIEPVR